MADQPTSPNSARINAMLQDLAAAKTAPTGPTPPPVNLPTQPQKPSPTPLAPVPTMPAPRPATPPPVAPRPPLPRPVIPTPPAPPATPPPQTPPGNQAYSSEMRTMSTDIGRISTGQAPVGIKPAPTPATPAPAIRPPIAPSTIAIPPMSGSSVGRKIFLGILGIAIIGGLAWIANLLFGSSQTAQVTPTATASPQETLATSGKSLSSYFSQNQSVPETSAFPAAVSAMVVGQWTSIQVSQTELFDSTGKMTSATTPGQRTILIAQVGDVSGANQAVSAWEVTGMANQLKTLLGYNTGTASGTIFSSGTYKNISVRYLNFPYPDHSIDWAIFTASNNNNYLVISGSRQSMFYAIDQLTQ